MTNTIPDIPIGTDSIVINIEALCFFPIDKISPMLGGYSHDAQLT